MITHQQKKPRILMVTHYFPSHGGGVEIVAGHIAELYTLRHKFEVSWFGSDCDPQPSSERLNCVPASSWNVLEQRFGIPYPLWAPRSLAKLWVETGKASVIHVHDYLYMGSLLACIFSILRKKPFIITQHIGLVPYQNKYLRGIHSLLNKFIGKWLLNRANKTVFVSEAVMQYFSTFTKFRSPPRVIPNGLDTSLFHPADERTRMALRKRLGIATDKPFLLFVGRFVEKKGLPILQKLISELASYTWILIGRGPIDPQSWNLSNLHVHYDLSQEQLVPLYQSADLLVLPSKGEGFPLVIQEAMACGTPALAGPDSAFAFVNGADLIYAEAVESSEVVMRWKKKIESILDDKAALLEMRGKVALHAHCTWSWEYCSDAYVKLIEEL